MNNKQTLEKKTSTFHPRDHLPPPKKTWVFPKIGVFPPNHPILIRFSIILTIHFGGKSPYFWEHPHHVFFSRGGGLTKEVKSQKDCKGLTVFFVSSYSQGQKNPPILSMGNPGWFIGILIMAYYNHYNPLCNENQPDFVHCSVVFWAQNPESGAPENISISLGMLYTWLQYVSMLVHTDTDTIFWTLLLVQNIDGSGLTNPQSYLNRSFPKERKKHGFMCCKVWGDQSACCRHVRLGADLMIRMIQHW